MTILCPGLSKTGTCSLNAALQHLGFRSEHYPCNDRERFECLVQGRGPVSLLHEVDAVTDLQAAVWFEELVDEFPKAEVVVTVRDTSALLKSTRGHFEKHPWQQISEVDRLFRLAAYGCVEWNEDKVRRAIHEHYRKVCRICEENRLRALCFKVSDGWEPLCRFLGKEIPNVPFPKINVTPPRRAQGCDQKADPGSPDARACGARHEEGGS